MSDESGERKIVTVDLVDGTSTQWLRPALAQQLLQPYHHGYDSFVAISYLSAVLGLLTFSGWLGFSAWVGSKSMKDKRVRGALEIVSGAKLSRLVVEAKEAGPYKLAGVTLPKDVPMRGINLIGSQGGGKTVASQDLLQQVTEHDGRLRAQHGDTAGKKIIIFDQSSEYFTAHFRPGKDVFFNPALEGSVPWSIFEELQYTYDADTLAHAFLPKKSGVSSGGGGFFEDAARALFSVLLRKLAEAGAKHTCDLADAFFNLPDEDMNDLIAGTIASSSIGGDSKAQRQGVISSIAIYLNGIASVQPGSWSVRKFINSPGDARLFILGSQSTMAMYAPLFRLMLSVAFEAIAAKQEIVREDKYWFFLDEVHVLGDIKIDSRLATLRKNGVCIVTGIQSDKQFDESMGKERGEVVMNCFNTVLILAANAASMQKRMSESLGAMEVDVVSRNQALAVTESRDGAGLTRMDKTKELVMQSDFKKLNVATGYLSLPGDYPAAKVDYSGWLKATRRRPSRADQWKPKVRLPGPDPRFLLKRAVSDDVMADIAAAAGQKRAQEAKVRTAADSGIDFSGPASSPGASGAASGEKMHRLADKWGGAAPSVEKTETDEAPKGEPRSKPANGSHLSLVQAFRPASNEGSGEGGPVFAPGSDAPAAGEANDTAPTELPAVAGGETKVDSVRPAQAGAEGAGSKAPMDDVVEAPRERDVTREMSTLLNRGGALTRVMGEEVGAKADRGAAEQAASERTPPLHLPTDQSNSRQLDLGI
jgi:hypothetical protein